MLLENFCGFFWRLREGNNRRRFIDNLLNELAIRLTAWAAAKEMYHNQHQLVQNRLWFLVNVCAQAVEVKEH
jgi:hypothetical protein